MATGTPNTLRISELCEIASEVSAYLLDCRARNLSAGTLRFYAQKLEYLRAYLDDLGIVTVDQITAPALRGFFLHESGRRTPGGLAAIYRATSAFLRWWEAEVEPGPDWTNPILSVKPPKTSDDLLPPADLTRSAP